MAFYNNSIQLLHVSNSFACRLEASVTHNVISEIVIVVHRHLAIIVLGYDRCHTVVGIPFRVADNEGVRVV